MRPFLGLSASYQHLDRCPGLALGILSVSHSRKLLRPDDKSPSGEGWRGPPFVFLGIILRYFAWPHYVVSRQTRACDKHGIDRVNRGVCGTPELASYCSSIDDPFEPTTKRNYHPKTAQFSHSCYYSN